MASGAAAAAHSDSLSAYLNDANSRSGAASSFAPLRGTAGDRLSATLHRATGAELLAAARSAPAGTPVQQQQLHATLLATPLSRTTGGKLGRAPPQPSLLDQYMNNVAGSVARLGTSTGKQPQQVAGTTLTTRFTPRGVPSPLRQPLFGNAAAGTTAAGLAPALSARKADLAAQLQSIDLAVARSTAVLASSNVAAAGAMPPASGRSDFRIPAVHSTPARVSGGTGGAAPGAAPAAIVPSGDWSVNIRLTASPRHGSSSGLCAVSDAASISAHSHTGSPVGSATSRSVAERITALQLTAGALSLQQQLHARAPPLAPSSKAAGNSGSSNMQAMLSRINQLEAQVHVQELDGWAAGRLNDGRSSSV